jgi:hypothetical protein
MSKRGSARAVLAGAAVIALAGCSGAPDGTVPEVPGHTATSHTAAGATPGRTAGTTPGATPTATVSSTARVPGTGYSATPGTGTGRGSFVRAGSIPFPVAVGNTWVYRTTAGAAGAAAGQATDKIISAGPGQDGYEVTMSSASSASGAGVAVRSVYVFYPDGTIGYPVGPAGGVPVAGVARWPDAASLASGRVSHSVLRVPAGQGQAADVTVQGQGTAVVSVPAGTFQASVVTMTIAAGTGTVQVTTWIAQGIGVVKTMTLLRAGGRTVVLATRQLRSFTRGTGAVVGIGS